MRYDVRCESCDRPVNLNRSGRYRRHFAVEPDGRRHLCAASGRDPEGVVRLLAAARRRPRRF